MHDEVHGGGCVCQTCGHEPIEEIMDDLVTEEGDSWVCSECGSVNSFDESFMG